MRSSIESSYSADAVDVALQQGRYLVTEPPADLGRGDAVIEPERRRSVPQGELDGRIFDALCAPSSTPGLSSRPSTALGWISATAGLTSGRLD
jgi:hypothetical protein